MHFARLSAAWIALAAATPSLAIVKSIIGPSDCTSGVLCCTTVTAPPLGILSLPNPLEPAYAATGCTAVTDMTTAPLLW